MNPFHTGGAASPDVVVRAISIRLSNGDGAIEGLIVVKINGEGRGVTCRAMKPHIKT